jgi:hypothetical protein
MKVTGTTDYLYLVAYSQSYELLVIKFPRNIGQTKQMKDLDMQSSMIQLKDNHQIILHKHYNIKEHSKYDKAKDVW